MTNHIVPGRGQAPPLEYPATLDVVVPCTGAGCTAHVLEHAAALVEGLNATVRLVAVYVVPFPADLVCPLSVTQHLTSRMSQVSAESALRPSVHLVVARSLIEGFHHSLRPDTAVLLGSDRRPWRTREEKLARQLSREGYKVSLLYVSGRQL